MVKVKICGLKRVEDIEIVNNFRPDYIGFVFAPSKRQISLDEAKHLKSLLHPSISAVGVFVNEPIENILKYEEGKVMDIIQLHGDEDIVYLKKLKKASHLPIIKAFRIKDERSLEEQYELLKSEDFDFALLDTYHPSNYGGSGESFNWQLLKKMHRPYFLAGGIGIENIEEALRNLPYAIDVSSKVETNGVKDGDKIKQLMEKLRMKQ